MRYYNALLLAGLSLAAAAAASSPDSSLQPRKARHKKGSGKTAATSIADDADSIPGTVQLPVIYLDFVPTVWLSIGPLLPLGDDGAVSAPPPISLLRSHQLVLDTGSRSIAVGPNCARSINRGICKYAQHTRAAPPQMHAHRYHHNGNDDHVVDFGVREDAAAAAASQNITSKSAFYGLGSYDYINACARIVAGRPTLDLYHPVEAIKNSSTMMLGVFGLGPLPDYHHQPEAAAAAAANPPSLLDSLVNLSVIASPLFALTLPTAESGLKKLTLGGVDRSKFTGFLEKVPLVPAGRLSPRRRDDTRYWVQLDSIRLSHRPYASTTANKTVDTTDATVMSRPVVVALDSTYRVSILPDDVVQAIWSAFPDGKQAIFLDLQLLEVSCEWREVMSVGVGGSGDEATAKFRFGAVTIRVPYRELVMRAFGGCFLAIGKRSVSAAEIAAERYRAEQQRKKDRQRQRYWRKKQAKKQRAKDRQRQKQQQGHMLQEKLKNYQKSPKNQKRKSSPLPLPLPEQKTTPPVIYSIGQVLMSSAYIVYDQANRAVWMAQAQECGASELQAVPTGPMGPGRLLGRCYTTAAQLCRGARARVRAVKEELQSSRSLTKLSKDKLKAKLKELQAARQRCLEQAAPVEAKARKTWEAAWVEAGGKVTNAEAAREAEAREDGF